MCRFTIATLECGHPQEDHVDTYGCPYFQRSNLHCDRDNPNYKDRFTIRTTDRDGICNRCLSVARKREEEAIEREQRKYDEQRRREAKEREEELRRGEREVLEKGHRQAEEERQAERRRREEAQRAQERQKRASDERLKEIERKSREEYDRQIQNQMDKDMEYMMRKSREEAERREREEEEEIQRALAESARLIQSERSSRDESPASGSRDLSEGRIESWIQSMSRTTTTTTFTHDQSQGSYNSQTNTGYPQAAASPPSPPATPPTRKAASPPPPPPLPIAAPKSPVNKTAPRAPPPPPAPKPTTGTPQLKEINYSLPAVGDQKIGRFRLGSRAVPIHESQDIPETPQTPIKPMTPSSPAPFVRLGGAIPASDVPIVREIKGQVMPIDSTAAARTGPPIPIRKHSESRKGPPPPVPDRSGKDPQLEAMLAKRRAWEPEDEEDKTITPPRSPGKVTVEDKARRLTAVEFDSKRKMGWKKDGEDD